MTSPNSTLAAVCRAQLLGPKWLVAPNRRVGQQWIDQVVRCGEAVVNLRPTTMLGLAMELLGPRIAERGVTFIDRTAGALVVAALWDRLRADGYFRRVENDVDLTGLAFDALLEMRLADGAEAALAKGCLTSVRKGEDLAVLAHEYATYCRTHGIIDEADVFRDATESLRATPDGWAENGVILTPPGIANRSVEQRFLAAFPTGVVMPIAHPLEQAPGSQRSATFFRAVGEANEVREVLRRALAAGTPLDQIEIVHTDAAKYVPLVYALAKRYSNESARSDGIPVTFAEGIPAILSRPGRALSLWWQWLCEDYSQRIFLQLVADGLLALPEGMSAASMVRTLRPLAIGRGKTNYLPKIEEQLAHERASHESDEVDPAQTTERHAAHERRLAVLRATHDFMAPLLAATPDGDVDGRTSLRAAETFLTKYARKVNELDQHVAVSLVESLQDLQIWSERLGVEPDAASAIERLPHEVQVMGSGPRPGHLHLTSLAGGGHSGRPRTFLLGMNDPRFPGAALQDPILLDEERQALSAELEGSRQRLRNRLEQFHQLLGLAGDITISWPAFDLAKDRETFPCSAVVASYRAIRNLPGADLEALNAAVGSPVSFAPTDPTHCLNANDRWIWQLTQAGVHGRDQSATVEAFFPQLARGRTAAVHRFSTFGPYSGHVPDAGANLKLFAADGLTLSASKLESAGQCPLRFFYQNALGILPPEVFELDEDRWLDAAQFGTLLHEVFRDFLTALAKAELRPDFERDHLELSRILHAAIDTCRAAIPPANEQAFRVQCWQLIQTAKIFLQAETEHCRSSQPRFFEVAIGMPADAKRPASPLDMEEPARIILPSGQTIRVRGQIDRIDQVDVKTFAIWDYKTGSAFGYAANDPFQRGRRVQSAIYLRIIENRLRGELGADARVASFGYFFPGTRAQGLRLSWPTAELKDGLPIVSRICGTLDRGAFVATDVADDCRFCDFRSICRHGKRIADTSKEWLDAGATLALADFREVRRG